MPIEYLRDSVVQYVGKYDAGCDEPNTPEHTRRVVLEYSARLETRVSSRTFTFFPHFLRPFLKTYSDRRELRNYRRNATIRSDPIPIRAQTFERVSSGNF